VPIWSHSRIASFEKCPLQYRYRYIDRIKRDTQSIEAFLGNRVHEALERLYQEAARGRAPALADLIDSYHRDWETKFSDRITIVRAGDGPDLYRRRGESCLATYYARHHPFDQAETVGLEERVQMALDGEGRYQVQGFIDRLARAADGVLEIHDYNTSNTLPRPEDLKRDRQLSLYQMAVQKRFPEDREVRLIWHYLVQDRTLESSRSPADLDRTRKETIKAIDRIEAARDYPPHESALCRWCEYRDICPLFATTAASPRPGEDAVEEARPTEGPRAEGPRAEAPRVEARPEPAPVPIRTPPPVPAGAPAKAAVPPPRGTQMPLPF
jgi:putative RecB family exonuclease